MMSLDLPVEGWKYMKGYVLSTYIHGLPSPKNGRAIIVGVNVLVNIQKGFIYNLN